MREYWERAVRTCRLAVVPGVIFLCRKRGDGAPKWATRAGKYETFSTDRPQ